MNETKESKATKHHATTRKTHVGEIVHYWRSKAQSNGTYALEPTAAIVSGVKVPGGNFQEKDQAACLWLFSDKQGAGLEQKAGVMRSDTPQDGRYTILNVK